MLREGSGIQMNSVHVQRRSAFEGFIKEYNHMVANSMDQLRPFFTHRPIREERQPLAEHVGQIDFILMTSEDDLVTHHCHVFNKNQMSPRRLALRKHVASADSCASPLAQGLEAHQ